MDELSNQRCYHHRRREAVVRCPDCHRFFCRECVTEHDDRMLCAQCLGALSGGHEKKSGAWARGLVLLTQGTLGFMLLWYAFYVVGLMLLAIPHSFHEGTIWEATRWGVK